MQVVEKTHRINVDIFGSGTSYIKDLILKNLPTAQITEDDAVVYRGSQAEKKIKSRRTPALVLKAYRERAGLSVTELAKKIDVQYTNISAMEHGRRAIGLEMAKKLSKVLGCSYTKFL